MAEVTLERDEWMRRTGPLYPGLVALCCLSAIPLPRGLEPTGEDIARAAWWFPVVGAGIATSLAALAWFLSAIGLVPGVTALIVVIAGVVGTRAMLERGVAATFDGYLQGRGGRSSAAWRSWSHSSGGEQWHDSGPVVWSAVAVVCALALRAGALMGMSTSSYIWWAALVIAHASARWVLILLPKLVERGATQASLLSSLGDISWRMFGVASGVVILLALFFGQLAGAVIVLAIAALAFGVTRVLQQRPDAVSDSVTTAAACVCEIAILVAFAAVHPAVRSPWVL